ncbi:MAG: alpha/beta fold hydrolase [Acidobacteria bacterium]|nr:alpha/beta fold hydrolase [Acidobacteriota bacterium]
MHARYSIWTLALVLAVPMAAREQAAVPRQAGYTVFLRGTPVGREDVTVVQDASGITITGRGRLSAPLNVLTRRVEVKYRPDWTPEFLTVDASVEGGDTTLKTSFLDETALAEGTVGGQRLAHTDVVSRQPFVLPNAFFGSYEAIARRLSAAEAGSEYRVYVGPRLPELTFRLSSVSTERMQTGTSTFNVRRYVLVFAGAGGVIPVNLYADEQGTLLRVNVPSQALDVVRDDLAASTARTLVYANPGDEAVTIPAAGFNLGATLTRPRNAPDAARLPVVILVGGAASGDRDGVVAGVPILGQIAGTLADGGFLALRYDKRGYGQSGGRAESATVGDFADDTRAVVRWLRNRRDVDGDRLAVLGHHEGAWVALLAASRERRITAVVSIAAPSTTGARWVLEQQRQTLEAMKAAPDDREAKVELQNRINAAVLTGRGWDGIAPEIRRQADTPWFQSLLAFDPAKVIEDVRQPLLFVHGQLDREVPVAHVDRIATLAREESDSRSVTVLSVRGVNHLLVPAVTGEITEYATLQDRAVSGDVTSAVSEWLTRTFAAIR